MLKNTAIRKATGCDSIPPKILILNALSFHLLGKRHVSYFRPLSVLTAIIFKKNMDVQMKAQAELVYHISHILSAYRKHFSNRHVLIQVTGNIEKMSRLDLSKAFDALPHDLIVAKFCAYKFNKYAAILICSYLRHRLQRVKFGDTHSDCLHIKRCVPQGTIVGTILFNYFFNDLMY